jgi:hypothetical protein
VAALTKEVVVKNRLAIIILSLVVFIGIAFQSVPAARAQNQVMGEIEFDAGNKPAKDAGVWVDSEYVGYLKELKGSKKILLLPGEHEISVRQSGYQNHTENVLLEPGKKTTIRVSLQKDPAAQYASVTAEIKLAVEPDRAAVFLDGNYAGHAHDFGGVGRAMLVSPGSHKIKIALPGYRTFETEVKLLANQKYEIKTVLPAGSVTETDPLIKQN